MPKTGLALDLHDAGCVRFGSFTLRSGVRSPIYIDLRRLVTYPALLKRVGIAMLDLLSALRFDRLAALPYTALPIGCAVSLMGQLPLIYPRREAKDYGTRRVIEGEFEAGERVVVLDDVISTGGSKVEAIEVFRAADLVVEDIVVLIDRRSTADRSDELAGCRLHSVFTLEQLLELLHGVDLITDGQVLEVITFLEHPE